MKMIMLQKLLQIVFFVLCGIVAAKHSGLAYIELGGGTLASPLVAINTSGGRLFVAAAILSLICCRLAAIGGLVASLLCLPLYFYIMVPGVFQFLLPGAYRYLSRTNFIWDEWAFSGILLLVLTDFVCFLALSRMVLENESNWLGVRIKQLTIQKLLLIVSCIICAIVSLKLVLRFDNPEWHEGALLDLNAIGFFMLLFALVLVFINPRRVAVCALIGSVLNLPLYLYLTAPGLAQRIFPGNYSARAQSIFVWDDWALAGILSLAVLAYICLRSFSALRLKSAIGA
jgi:hypothetical protein